MTIMEKKEYIKPGLLSVQLNTRSTIMQMSAVDSLDMDYQGDTSSGSVIEANSRVISDKSIWENNW
jgi:hypothetical protein